MALLHHHPPFSSLLRASPFLRNRLFISPTLLPCRPLSRSMRASLPLRKLAVGPVCGCTTSDPTVSQTASPPSSRIFIKVQDCLGFLAKTFSSFGEVRKVKIITSKRAKQSLGLAYVWFANEQDALMAVKEMDGKVVFRFSEFF